MFPDPLHPAVVHLPVALAVLIPVLAVLGAGMIYKSILPARSWILIVLLQALLVGSGWAASQTGENEEDRVERVVAEDLIDEHEEAAERFLFLAGLGLLATGTGLFAGRSGSIGRVVGSAATVVVLAAAISVGHSGGELVYKHGASVAHLPPDHKAAIQSGTILELHEKGNDGHEDDDDHDKDD